MIQIWLSYNNGAEKLRLPVNPEQISFEMTHGYEDFSSLQYGEMTQIGKSELQAISFSSFFPRDYEVSYCAYEDFPTPARCVEMIRTWQTSGNPMRLTITGTAINLAVTLRTFSIEMEKGGEPGDIYFEMEFKEYQFAPARTVAEKTTTDPKTGQKQAVVVAEAKKTRVNPQNKASTYTVQAGDSLYKIAAKANIYNQGNQWKKIYEANKSAIGPNPNKIKTGLKLVIP